jgi:hypothetical protein
MGWGNGIVLVIIGFVAVMGTMVTICVRQDDIHLVTANYYEEEIKYDNQIARISNTKNLEFAAIEFDGQLKKIDLKLPVGAKGTLHLFRPSDARVDQKITFDIQSSEKKSLDLSNLKPGYWKVKLTWTQGGLEYYEEKKINI